MTAEDKKRLLDLDNVSIVFGGLRAVSNLSMHIDEHELIGLIGPNGAGKTTAFNLITGVYVPTEGDITFNGVRINGKKSYQVTQLGMARTFQNIRLFSELPVIDNVKIAYHMHIGTIFLRLSSGPVNMSRKRMRSRKRPWSSLQSSIWKTMPMT